MLRVIRTILAFVFGERKDVVFRELKALLGLFGIFRFYSDDWGTWFWIGFISLLGGNGEIYILLVTTILVVVSTP